MNQTNEAIESVHLPVKYLGRTKSKNFATHLFKAFNLWFKCDDTTKIEEFKKTYKYLCNAIFLIDDIEDGSLMRKGLPCAHIVYGVASTFNSANYYYFYVLKKLAELVPEERRAEILLEYIETALRGHEGQAMDIYFRDNYIVPSEEEYRKMIDLKASFFFKFLYLFFKGVTNSNLDLDKLCSIMGQYFQIRDDYVNLKWDEFGKLKGFAEDISEGKFSFPIIHAIKQNPGDRTILNILKLRTQDEALKKIVIDYLEEAGSFDYTQKVLENLRDEIIEELNKFSEDNPLLKNMISMILMKEQQMFYN